MNTASKIISKQKQINKTGSNTRLASNRNQAAADGATAGTISSAYNFEQKLDEKNLGSDPFKSSNEIKRTFYVKDKIDVESALRDYGTQLVTARKAQQESRVSSRRTGARPLEKVPEIRRSVNSSLNSANLV